MSQTDQLPEIPDKPEQNYNQNEDYRKAAAHMGLPLFLLDPLPTPAPEEPPLELVEGEATETTTQELVPVLEPEPEPDLGPPISNKPPNLLPDIDPTTPDEWFLFFDKIFFVVMNKGKVVIIYEEFDNNLDRITIIFSNRKELNTLYVNKVVNINSKNEQVFDLWFKHCNRKSWDSIEFAPGKILPKSVYNLWRGYGYQPKPGDWSLLKNHIFIIIAGRNTDIFEYLMDWMADLIQLRDKPGVAIVLIGKKGTGKGIFVKMLGKLLGRHFVHLVHDRHLTGNFNTHLKDAMLIFADEAVWGGNKQAESVLKAMITEETLMIEPKGVNAFSVKSYARIIIATNADWVVPASEDERRYLAVEIRDDERGNHEYFDAINQQMQNGGYEAMLDELLNRDLTGKNLRNAPRTKALAGQIYQSDPVFQFLVYCLDSETLYSLNNTPVYWGDGKVPTTVLLNEFRCFMKSKGAGNYMMPENTFGKHLRKWLNVDEDDKHPLNCVKNSKIRVNGTQQKHYIFKDIDTCKKMIESKLGVEWPWASNSCEDDEPEETLNNVQYNFFEG